MFGCDSIKRHVLEYTFRVARDRGIRPFDPGEESAFIVGVKHYLSDVGIPRELMPNDSFLTYVCRQMRDLLEKQSRLNIRFCITDETKEELTELIGAYDL